MPTIRPAESSDLDAVAALRARPDVGTFLGYSRYVRPFELRDALQGATILAAFDGARVVASATIQPSPRARSHHLANIDLICGPGDTAAASALLEHVTDTADRWLQLHKLEINVDPDAPWLPIALHAGFEVEQRQPHRRWRAGESRMNLSLGRVRPGLPIASQASAPTPPIRGPRAQVTLRPAVPSDAAAFARLHRDESVLRGPLQTPTRTVDTWRDMLAGTAATVSLAAEVEGRLVGAGVLMHGGRSSHRTYALGLAVETASQGRGVGGAIMRALIQSGRDDLGARRLELEVDAQNHAAHGLYAKCGFIDEGLRRAGSWRGDGYSHAIAMGLVYEP